MWTAVLVDWTFAKYFWHLEDDHYVVLRFVPSEFCLFGKTAVLSVQAFTHACRVLLKGVKAPSPD